MMIPSDHEPHAYPYKDINDTHIYIEAVAKASMARI